MKNEEAPASPSDCIVDTQSYVQVSMSTLQKAMSFVDDPAVLYRSRLTTTGPNLRGVA